MPIKSLKTDTHLKLMSTTDEPLSLKDYLFKHGLTEADEETLKYAKAAHAKQYIKHYHQHVYSKEKKQIKVTLSLQEHERLQEGAKKHKQKLAVFAREAMYAHLSQTYLVPDKTAISDITVSLRKIGNNINQIAHHTNAVQYLTYGNTTKLRQKVYELEDKISQALRRLLICWKWLPRRFKKILL